MKEAFSEILNYRISEYENKLDQKMSQCKRAGILMVILALKEIRNDLIKIIEMEEEIAKPESQIPTKF